MFIKVFFGKINPAKISENGTNVSFWDSENYFSKLADPIDWEHGVLQYYCDENDNDFFWWTLNENLGFKKASQEDFSKTLNKSLNKFKEKSFLTDLFENVCVNVADPFDIEDDYSESSFCVEDTSTLDISEYSNYDEESKNLWVFEVTRYENPPVEINGDEFEIKCENNEDELAMNCRFMFCIDNS